MTCPSKDFVIQKGKTFSRVLRWESLPFIYKAITAITKAAPVVITATGHGIPDGWRAAVISAGGMRQINAKKWPAASDEFHKVTVLTVNTVELNAISSADFSTYTEGGYLAFRTPVSLAGYTARMQIRATEESTGDPLVSLTTENGGITLDNTAKTITLLIAATATDDFAFDVGVYDLEMVSGTGVVTQLLKGNITVTEEVTR